MNTTVDIDPRLLAAATAAAGALWSPAPLEPAEPVAGGSAAALLPAGGSAFQATFTGTSHGSVLLVMLLGQSRVFFAMASDGLLPGRIARVHPRFHTPHLAQLAVGARGVLEAAATSGGPVALGSVTEVDAEAALAQEPGYVVFPMTADGKVHAVLAIAMSKRVEQRSGSDSGSSGSASRSSRPRTSPVPACR